MCDDVKLEEYRDRSRYLERVKEKRILRGKKGFCSWESRSRRDVCDVGFGGWSRSDVAAVAENRWRRGLRKRVAIGRIGLCLGAFALTALGNSMACMSGKRAWGRVGVVVVR